jgi:Rps23 Pro-64 3,4-dihydroxylase Tpa1-like proline 4-hydroxylase
MELIKLTEDIHLYKNFISKEESEAVVALLNKIAETEEGYWKGISFYESYSARYPFDGEEILKEYGLSDTWFSDIQQRFKEAAAVVAGKSADEMSKISFHVQRWLPGAFAPKHSDNSSNEGVLGAFTRSRYAGFLYLNDDFEGGTLKFDAEHGKTPLEIVPETGSFLVFHGGHKNMHEVTVVKGKPRYTLGSFWDDREEEDYPKELRDEWADELAEVRAYQKGEQEQWQDIREKGLRLSPYGKTVPASEVEEI